MNPLQVLALDEERRRALVAGDVDALRRLLAPDCRWVHASGAVQSGSDYLAALAEGAFSYSRLDADEVTTTARDGVVVLTYLQEASMTIDSAPHASRSRCSATWATDEQGRVQLLALTSTPVRA